MSDSTEARIEVVWPQYEVKDLHLYLKLGEKPEFVSRMRAEVSKDLREAKRLGAVRVSWVRRCLVSKPPRNQAPPSARRMPKPVPKRKTEIVPVDEDAIADKVAAKLSQNLDQRDARLRQELREMVEKGGTVDAAELANLLAEGLAAKLPQQVIVQQGGQAGGSESVSDEPMYIPSEIIPKDAKASIKATETKSDSGQTDDAAAKLAALRKKKAEESK